MANLKVRDLMTEEVLTLGAEDNLASLYDLMDSRHIRHVPIVDEDDTLVGIVSDRDLLRGALGEESSLPLSVRRQMLEQLKVEEIMNTEPMTVEPEQAVREAGELLMELKVSCLPVVDGGRLVGIITESDFVRYLTENA
ncbi:MAG: CBS domain-containing protein [Myxococcales bacterium]|nr:CBS domain-containing protein [Myxococcales bacterium]